MFEAEATILAFGLQDLTSLETDVQDVQGKRDADGAVDDHQVCS